MNDSIKQAIYDELNIILKEPGLKNEQRLQQLKFTESKSQHMSKMSKISQFLILARLWNLFD